MTVTELARLLGKAIAQGRGDHQVALYQWQHGWQPLTAAEHRDAAGVLELYSNTVDVHVLAPVDEDEDLLGLPEADEPDLDDLI